jgi:hypothetical protein
MRHLRAMSPMKALSKASGRAPEKGLIEAVQRPEFGLREGVEMAHSPAHERRYVEGDVWRLLSGLLRVGKSSPDQSTIEMHVVLSLRHAESGLCFHNNQTLTF